jgi:uncharacterized protein YqeY
VAPDASRHADIRVRRGGRLGTLRRVTTDSTLRTRLRSDLLRARKDRDAETVSTLRTALAALENAEAVPTDATAGAMEAAPAGVGATDAPRRELTDADELAVLDTEIASLLEAGQAYACSAPERAAAARRAAAQLSRMREA